ncbi:MAG: endonuclease/exonuclease/phosphatase family protein [Candidatus Caenarcaniphilales bacterium]|nr:endonuclease/exonuclease/phosphatase family protein [Candidatus Caenarcaniphilales bacterium]
MKIKIGTFNTENLFLRYRLLDKERGSRGAKKIDFEDFEKNGYINLLGWTIEDFGPVGMAARKLTAKVITQNDPDIIALQEVENLEALLQFNRKYLDNLYPFAMVIDGNDLRQIDVGLLSKYEIGCVRTHRFEPEGSAPSARTFSRDCLEATVNLPEGKNLTFFVNHFKSKIGGGEEKRQVQSERVAEILKERFGESLEGNFVVVGDLNNNYDAPELQSLLALDDLENVILRLPEDERWTHYYKKGKLAEQLDYILLSPDLKNKNIKEKPFIERRGLGSDIDFYDGERFDESLTGKDGASDHCAVFIELTI